MEIGKQMIIYRDEKYYSAFPSTLRLSNGELLVAFRRAPQRQPYSSHLDSESQAVMVRSADNGETWSPVTVIYKEDNDVGIQAPSIMQCQDGTMISNFFKWQVIKQPPFNHSVIGTFVSRSDDEGKTWDLPVKVEVAKYKGIVATAEPVVELPNDELLMPCYDRSGSFVMRSRDRGLTWGERSDIVNCPLSNILNEHQPGEPTIAVLPSGKLLCMMRENHKGYLLQSESNDLGKTWTAPVQTQLWGFPANLLVLNDGRILCSYGYRRPPFGVRACISENEGKTWNLLDEIIISKNLAHGDLGYPASIQLPDGNVFTAYYFHETSNKENDDGIHFTRKPASTRYIAGAFYRV